LNVFREIAADPVNNFVNLPTTLTKGELCT
jgi:hypothetical protein